MDKKQKIVIGGVGISIGVIGVIGLLYNYYKRVEPELTKEEIRELEYDEYVRPSYKNKHFEVFTSNRNDVREEGRLRVSGNKYGRNRFNVIQAREGMRGARERIRLDVHGNL